MRNHENTCRCDEPLCRCRNDCPTKPTERFRVAVSPVPSMTTARRACQYAPIEEGNRFQRAEQSVSNARAQSAAGVHRSCLADSALKRSVERLSLKHRNVLLDWERSVGSLFPKWVEKHSPPGDFLNRPQSLMVLKPYLDFELFRKNISAELTKLAPGASYAFTIKGNPREPTLSYQNGWARLGEVPMSSAQPVMTASVGKSITASAVLFALDNVPGISEDDPIWIYFPKTWKFASAFKKITLGDALRFRVGINANSDPGGGSGGLASVIAWTSNLAYGADKLDPSKIGGGPENWTYNNQCYAWFRIVLFSLCMSATGKKEGDELYATDVDAWHLGVSTWYKNFVIDYILRPGAMASTTPFGIPGLKETLYYPYPCNNPCVGSTASDWLLSSGAAGWFISTSELANYMARVWGGLLSPTSFMKLFSNSEVEHEAIVHSRGKLFFQKPAQQGPSKVYYFTKGGSVAKSKGRLVFFEDGIKVALASNCNMMSDLLRDAVINAYKVSFLAK